VAWPLLGDAVLPLSAVDVRGESIDGGVGRSRLFVEDSLRSVVRGGLLYTECDAQGLGYLAKGNVVECMESNEQFFLLWQEGWRMCLSGCEWRTSIRPSSVGGVCKG
jgi:hypothetical protein